MSNRPLQPSFTSQFKKDVKRCVKAHLPMDELKDIMDRLIRRTPLEAKHKDHQLTGNNQGFRDCHIRPNWLLIYTTTATEITFTRTGTHAELFGK